MISVEKRKLSYPCVFNALTRGNFHYNLVMAVVFEKLEWCLIIMHSFRHNTNVGCTERWMDRNHGLTIYIVLWMLCMLTGKRPFSRITRVSWYQVSFLDFIGVKGGVGGDNCSYKTCKAPVKLSPLPTHYSVLQTRCLSCCLQYTMTCDKNNYSQYTSVGGKLPFSSKNFCVLST